MYQVVRKFLFFLEPERAHYVAMNALSFLCNITFIKKAFARLFSSEKAEAASFLNITFKHRIGLGAGFDKNARYLNALETLGFAFVEIGTVTPRPQAGNEKPRLFRLPKDGALINRMGFNNDGVEAVKERLKQWRKKQRTGSQKNGIHPPMIIGGNIGKNKNTPNEDAWKDYEICFSALHPYVDFFVVNVSSPNTPGLRELQEKESLKKILTHLQQQQPENRKPILLKIAPDLTTSQIEDVIDLALEINLDGLVAANTTINREGLTSDPSLLESIGNGGLSGRPVRERATEMVDYIHQKTGGKIPIIASGGVFTANDAAEKLAAGAAMVEVWTGFIYEGPMIVKRISSSLL